MLTSTQQQADIGEIKSMLAILKAIQEYQKEIAALVARAPIICTNLMDRTTANPLADLVAAQDRRFDNVSHTGYLSASDAFKREIASLNERIEELVQAAKEQAQPEGEVNQ